MKRNIFLVLMICGISWCNAIASDKEQKYIVDQWCECIAGKYIEEDEIEKHERISTVNTYLLLTKEFNDGTRSKYRVLGEYHTFGMTRCNSELKNHPSCTTR